MQFDAIPDDEIVSDALSQVAARVEGLAVAQFDGAGLWCVIFEDELILELEGHGQPPRIVLSSLLGQVEEERKVEVLSTLLAYNAMWRQTDGLKTALDESSGELQLIYEWRLPELHFNEAQLEEFSAVLANVADVARWWRAYVSRPTEGRPVSALDKHAPLGLHA